MDALHLDLGGVIRLDRCREARELVHLRRSARLALGSRQRRPRLGHRSGGDGVSLVACGNAHESVEGERETTVVKDDGVHRLIGDLGGREVGGGGSECGGDDSKVDPRVELGDEFERLQSRRHLLGACTSVVECLLASSHHFCRRDIACPALMLLKDSTRLPAPTNPTLVGQPPAYVPSYPKSVPHELATRTSVRHKLHRVTWLGGLAVIWQIGNTHT